MVDRFELDDSYKPPTREFIQNFLTFGLLSDSTESPVQSLLGNSSDLEYLTRERGRIISWLIKYAFENKEIIRRIPIFGGVALSLKKRMINMTSDVLDLDLSGIMGLGIDDFIWKLYALTLGRPPDTEGLERYRFALNNGAKKEAVIYMLCTSKEFAARRRVAHLNEYRKAFWLYRIREAIKRFPLLGWLWAFAAIPRRFARLSEALLLRFNELQARINTTDSENLERFHSLSAQLKALSIQNNELQAQAESQNLDLQARVESLHSDIQRVESLHLDLQARVESLHSDLQARVESLHSENLSAFSKLDDAIQNSNHANRKLDELETLLLKHANQDRLVVSGFPGGVTAVQTKDYIFGVPSEDWRLAVFLSLYGFFEPGTEKYFRSIIREGMNVLDLGANLGIYTLHALAAGCRTYSYEPTPRIFKILSDNVGINGFEPTGRANLYNLAVSDKEGEAEFVVHENTSGQNNSLFGTGLEDKTIRVKTVYLDKHLGHLDHIDVAKIDVEGAEPLVLKGMQAIVAKNPSLKIIMEFAPSHLKRAGNNPQDFIREIHAMGFDIQQIDKESGEIREISDEDLCTAYSVNVLLAKAP